MTAINLLSIIDKIKNLNVEPNCPKTNADAFGVKLCATLRSLTPDIIRNGIAEFSKAVQKSRAASLKKFTQTTRILMLSKAATTSNADVIAKVCQWACEQVVERDAVIKAQLLPTLQKIVALSWRTSKTKHTERDPNTLSDKDDIECVCSVILEDMATLAKEDVVTIYEAMCKHWWLSRHATLTVGDGVVEVRVAVETKGKEANFPFVMDGPAPADCLLEGQKWVISAVCAAIKKRMQNKVHARKSRSMHGKRKQATQDHMAETQAQKRACIALMRSSAREYHNALALLVQAEVASLHAAWTKK